jgi:hypothetical protein
MQPIADYEGTAPEISKPKAVVVGFDATRTVPSNGASGLTLLANGSQLVFFSFFAVRVSPRRKVSVCGNEAARLSNELRRFVEIIQRHHLIRRVHVPVRYADYRRGDAFACDVNRVTSASHR